MFFVFLINFWRKHEKTNNNFNLKNKYLAAFLRISLAIFTSWTAASHWTTCATCPGPDMRLLDSSLSDHHFLWLLFFFPWLHILMPAILLANIIQSRCHNQFWPFFFCIPTPIPQLHSCPWYGQRPSAAFAPARSPGKTWGANNNIQSQRNVNCLFFIGTISKESLPVF